MLKTKVQSRKLILTIYYITNKQLFVPNYYPNRLNKKIKRVAHNIVNAKGKLKQFQLLDVACLNQNYI